MVLTQLNRYELQISENASIPVIQRTTLAGISRVCRVSKKFQKEHDQVIWDTGCNIIGPMLFFFTWWVLESAKKQGISRLYFLSRDGYLSWQIAQLLNGKIASGIECSYLYGSRHLWLTTSLQQIDQHELDWILSDWWSDLNVGVVCSRLGILPEHISEYLNVYGFNQSSWNIKFDSILKMKMAACLSDLKVQNRIKELLEKQYHQAISYLTQEGLAQKNKFGIVDVGWKGGPQVALNKLLRRSNIDLPYGIHGFYVGLVESSRFVPGDSMQSFLFDLSLSLNGCQLRNNHLLEAFVSSDQGKIQSFIEKDGVVIPKINDDYKNVIDWGVRIQHEAVLNFSCALLKQVSFTQWKIEDIKQVIRNNIGMFLNTPTDKEAEVYGSFPMDGELTEHKVQEIAPRVTRSEFWDKCFHLKQFNLFWVQASLIRSRLHMEIIIWRVILPLLEYGYYSLMLLKNAFKYVKRS